MVSESVSVRMRARPEGRGGFRRGWREASRGPAACGTPSARRRDRDRRREHGMLTDEAKRRITALGYNPDNLIEPVRQTLEELSPEEISAALVFHERLKAKLAAQGAQDVQGYIAQ